MVGRTSSPPRSHSNGSAFADAQRHLRQARRETRGIEAPLASWRIEAVTATLLERTAQPDSARRARMKYERAFHRLARSIEEHQFAGRWDPFPGRRRPSALTLRGFPADLG